MKICKRAAFFLAAAVLFAASPLGADGRYYPANDLEDRVFVRGNREEKRVALTFDDGPHREYTDEILDILSEYGVKATFFVIGVNAELCPAPLKRAIAEGHEIGSHTYSHRDFPRLSEKEIVGEIEKNAAVLGKFGVKARLFRPPGGFCEEKVVRSAQKEDCDVVLWTIDTCDWRGVSAGEIVRAASRLRGGEIILMHDYVSGVSHTPEALRILLPALLDKGFSFATAGALVADAKAGNDKGPEDV